ncbi:MAG: HAD family phosphatase [Micropruina sp.]
MQQRSAVVFDLDGTLTDTEELWDEVRRELAAIDGVKYRAEHTIAQMGMSTREWSTYVSEVVGLHGTPEENAGRIIGRLVGKYRHQLPVLSGAVQAVQRMAKLGPLGLASSSPRLLIDTALEVMGITELFASVRSTEEGAGRGKPAPDGYLWVCEQLGVEPSRAVAIEDSSNGILSALNAGMKVIAIPPSFHPPSAVVLARVDRVLDSLDELTPDLVTALLAD